MQLLTLPNRPHLLPGKALRTGGCGRAFDLVCSAAGVVLLWPLMLLVALLVVLFDGRPVLFGQERVGLNGKPFRMWKFRTMRSREAGADDPLITAAGDPRITRVGRWLRAFKLDELPQLFNVLVGEMSVIGPRPEVHRYVDLNDPTWQAVLSVRPGITDLATLAYLDEEQTLAATRNPESFYRETILPRKLDLNVRYVQVRTRRTDIDLVFLTLLQVLHLGRRDQDRLRKLLARN